MKKPIFKSMFKRLKGIGFNGDGPSNGMFLPDKTSVKNIDLPGHWSNHNSYTSKVGERLLDLNRLAPQLSDTQLVLGMKSIQDWARSGLQNGLFKVDPMTGRLL